MKGRIAVGADADIAVVDDRDVGADADIAVVDLDRRQTVRADALHSRGKVTPFAGTPTVGAPVHTLVRGRFVQRDRRLVADMAGHGRQVTEIQRMPAPVPRHTDQTLAAATKLAR